jgi:hypothetical protein
MAKEFDVAEGTGFIFANKNKKHEKAPDWQGTMKVDGVELKFGVWERSSSGAGKFFALKLDTYGSTRAAGTYPREVKNRDDDVPF